MKIDELKCKYCGDEMFLGGSDHDLEDGCYHTYWVCKKCSVIAIENVRYGNRVNIEWVKEDEENEKTILS
jgi:hypothetical protein